MLLNTYSLQLLKTCACVYLRDIADVLYPPGMQLLTALRTRMFVHRSSLNSGRHLDSWILRKKWGMREDVVMSFLVEGGIMTRPLKLGFVVSAWCNYVQLISAMSLSQY